MAKEKTGTGLINIRRFSSQYLVPEGFPSPERACSKLDEIVSGYLPDILRQTASGLFQTSDTSVWFIRNLKLDLNVNTAWDRDVIAERWALQITRELSHALSDEGVAGEGIVRFPDRASYLASFVRDLAGGNAWGKWYYESFSGLQMLPVSSAIRTALCRDISTGVDTLLKLESGERSRVFSALGNQDLKRLLHSVSEEASKDTDYSSCFHALREAWKYEDTNDFRSGDEGKDALSLYLAVISRNRDIAGRSLLAAILSFICLDGILSGLGPAERKDLMVALAGRDVSRLYLAVGAERAETLRPLRDIPNDWLVSFSQELASSRKRTFPHAPPPGQVQKGTVEIRHTPFGGMFLLLPLLDELFPEEAFAGLLGLEGQSAASLLRFLFLTACFGHANFNRAFHDPVVRDIMGIDAPAGMDIIREWLMGLSGGNMQTVLSEVISRQYGNERTDERELVMASINDGPHQVSVLIDSRHGNWLFAIEHDSVDSAGLIDRFRETLRHLNSKKITVLCDERYAASLGNSLPAIAIEGLKGHAVHDAADYAPGVAEVLKRLERIPSDMAFLSMDEMHVPFNTGAAISVAAQNLLRSYSRRLPGFALSGLPYLFSNFLDLRATIEDEPERQVVRMGRPPLNLILGMTGLARKTYTISWLDKRKFVLYQE